MNSMLNKNGDNVFEWKGYDDVLEIGLEGIIGSDDFQHPWFLSKGWEVSRPVCVIDQAGTGFLIRKNLLLTNFHVFRTADWAKGQKIRFGYEYRNNTDPSPEAGDPYELDPDTFFYNNSELDYAAVFVKGDPGIKWGVFDLSQKSKVKIGSRINIVQHPGAEYKRIAIRDNQVKYFDDKVIQYLTDTERGSSGSPVFNDSWELVGLHHKSFEKDGTNLGYNQAHCIDAIWQDLSKHL